MMRKRPPQPKKFQEVAKRKAPQPGKKAEPVAATKAVRARAAEKHGRSSGSMIVAKRVPGEAAVASQVGQTQSQHPETARDIPPETAPSLIIVEIDPAVSGGYVSGRFDVMIRGRAMSAEPIEEIRILADDWVTSAALYGQPDQAASCVMPDGTPGRQRSFQFNLPRRGDGKPERCEFQIVARTADDAEYAEDFAIEIDVAAAEPVSVVLGPTRSVYTFGDVRPHAVMYIERGTIDLDRVLTVQGWAVSLGSILAIQIFVGEERIAKARTGGVRDDVAVVFPAYPKAHLSGFNLTIQLDEATSGAETVRAQMVCQNGFGLEESIPVQRLQRRTDPAPRPIIAALPGETSGLLPPADPLAPFYPLGSDLQVQGEPPQGLVILPPAMASLARAAESDLLESGSAIEMYCDLVELTCDGLLTVNGWAVSAFGITQIRVLIDDRDVGLATFGHMREDVAGTYPHIPMARLSGFKFETWLGGSYDDEHIVRVVICGARGGEVEKPHPIIATGVSGRSPSAPTAGQFTTTEVTPDEAAEFQFELDAPTLSNGTMVQPVTGRLTIEGWLLSRSGIAKFEVLLDDQFLGDAHYGLARQDVGAAFPEWPNSLRSGFAFHCPPRSLRGGEHTVRLAIRSNNGVTISRSFRISVEKTDGSDDAVAIRRRVPRVEVDMLSAYLSDISYQPSFRFVVRQGARVDSALLRKTLDALGRQAYADWTVKVLAEDDGAAAEAKRLVDDRVPWLADRFSFLCPSDSTVWEAPLVQPAGGRPTLYALLLPGDEPGADALLELAIASGRHKDRDLLYGDEVRISPVSGEREPFFKPDFSPDLLLSTNYIGRLWVATGELLAKTNVTPLSLFDSGEYDLVLRCTELAAGLHHIPKLLCQRSAVILDDPAQEQAALERTLHRRGIAGTIISTPIQGTWRVRRAAPSGGKVSIIIPTCASNGYIEACINTLRATTAYPDYEIICIDNIPASEVAWKLWLQQNADKTVDLPGPFNWSIFNNRATEVADGEYLLFLNDDIEITEPGWLDAMVEHAQRPEIGVVGPQLTYPDGKVQHAGMFLSTNGIGRHAFRFAASDDPCYFGLALTQRNVIAVTGACMLVRRDTFDRLGGFDEAHQIINNDLDFCLRAHRAGLLTVFTPYATLTHHELASRANMKDVFNLSHFDSAWKTTFAAGDPYFNLRLTKYAEDYRPDDEPVEWVVSGTPLFRPAEIERILVVKLDHIGDFVTALPPIRRLKQRFPNARITVLAGPASRAFVALESSIDEFIPFSFFHARSQLGERELTNEDYAALAEQLRPYRFDLAIDLRKHPSTRDVLKYTGARFLAGFDYLGQFPFLDVALDWDGDRNLQRKRSHIVDDLMALVDAVAHAAEDDRLLMQPGPPAMELAELPVEIRALYARPVVAIHPGAGNITKQWPEAHFSALIDLLIERNGVNILLVGGPDDVEIADSLLKTGLHPDRMASMAGRTSLSDLPRLLKTCVLYIGNDSGPKHIAAAVGMPTIGIHSGVVDPVEWGPIGPNAVALRRNMTCSPCYLANADDCPRALACLQFFEPSLVYETADRMLKAAPPLPEEPASGPEPPAIVSPEARPARKPRSKRRQDVTEPV